MREVQPCAHFTHARGYGLAPDLPESPDLPLYLGGPAAHGPGYALFLTDGAEAVLVGGKDKPQVVRLALEGANPHPAAQALEEQAAKSAYFLSNNPARWRTGVAHNGRVRYEAVYRGIDLVYYGAGRQLEYDWILAPGADPGRIPCASGRARRCGWTKPAVI